MADALMWPDDIYRILRDWDVTQISYVLFVKILEENRKHKQKGYRNG